MSPRMDSHAKQYTCTCRKLYNSTCGVPLKARCDEYRADSDEYKDDSDEYRADSDEYSTDSDEYRAVSDEYSDEYHVIV